MTENMGSVGSVRYRRRQKILTAQTLARQVSQGRASPLWRRCNDESCAKAQCLFRDPSWILVDNDRSKYGVPVRHFHHDFTHALASALWPDAIETLAAHIKAKSIAAFMDSPPVRHIFWKANWYFRSRYPSIEEKVVKQELARACSALQIFMNGVDPDSQVLRHKYLNLELQDENEELTVGSFLTHCACNMEQWRQSSLPFRPRWNFTGDPKVTSQIHLAILFHMWELGQEDCFTSMHLYGEHETTGIWNEWFGRYPLSIEKEDESEAGFVLDSMNRKGELKLRMKSLLWPTWAVSGSTCQFGRWGMWRLGEK